MSGNGNNWGNSSDAIINEIKKRVLQRDFEEFAIKRRNIPALGIDYLDILDDVTKLDRQEIERIAKEVISQHKYANKPQMSPRQQIRVNQDKVWQPQDRQSPAAFFKGFTKDLSLYKVLIVSSLLLLFGVLVTVMSKDLESELVNKEQDVEIQDRLAEHEQHKETIYEHIQQQGDEQALISKQNADESTRKWLFQSITTNFANSAMSINQFYSQHNRFPQNNSEIRSTLQKLTSQTGVSDAFVTNENGIALVLEPQFGTDILVHFTPKDYQSDFRILWQCETNASKALLANNYQQICNHNRQVRRLTLTPTIWAD